MEWFLLGFVLLLLFIAVEPFLRRFVPAVIEARRERARFRALVDSEEAQLEHLARARGGVLAREGDGYALVLKHDGRRAWVEATPGVPWSLGVALEVDRLLDLEISRPKVRKRLPNQRPGELPLSHEQPDLRFHVARAEEAGRDATERLFVHGGEDLSDALADLLYRLGADLVLARHGRLGVTVDVPSNVAERAGELLAALGRVAGAYARKPASVEIGAMTERYLWLSENAPRCPYCHEELAENDPGLTACGRCRTVHHEACFAEHGGCTLLGCGGTERAAPRARAQELPPA